MAASGTQRRSQFSGSRGVVIWALLVRLQLFPPRLVSFAGHAQCTMACTAVGSLNLACPTAMTMFPRRRNKGEKSRLLDGRRPIDSLCIGTPHIDYRRRAVFFSTTVPLSNHLRNPWARFRVGSLPVIKPQDPSFQVSTRCGARTRRSKS